MSSPTVSVVVPVYNREASIRGAVESVLRQTWTDFELIVVDDGSTDNTVAAVEAVADPRLRVLAQDANRGVSAARNAGIGAAKGAWVAFQDSDDEWLPDKLALQMARINAMGKDCIAAYCGMVVVHVPEHALTSDSRTRLHYLPASWVVPPEGDLSRPLTRTSFISTQTLIVRRDVLEAVGGFDEALTALVDWDLVLRIAPRGRFAFVDRPLVHQYFSENSITRSQARRTRNHELLLEKNRALFAPFPEHLAANYRTLSGGYRRTRNPRKALFWIGRAIRAEPARIKNYGVAAFLLAQLARGRGRADSPSRRDTF